MEPNLNHQTLSTSSTNPHGPGSYPDLHNYHGLPQYPFTASQTLPPLQGPHASSTSVNALLGPPNNVSNVSRPNPSNSTLSNSRLSAFPHLAPQVSTSGHVPSPLYQTSNQRYSNGQGYMSMPSTLQPYSQPIAPAPPRDRFPDFRPPSLGAINPLEPSQAARWISPENLTKSAQQIGQESPRTHVVGSQGRRGVLPSAPGRPAINGNGEGGKTTVIPQKDADGKFPCPHCNKTYLHAKHLKRHLLRHTGDRPYMCVLCKDTFSRSDILKRHFQKCSLRRGNPTGASHLSNPQAHLKKSKAAAAAASQSASSSNISTPTVSTPTNGMNGMTNGFLPHPSPAVNGMPSGQPTYLDHPPSVSFPASSAPDMSNAYFYQSTPGSPATMGVGLSSLNSNGANHGPPSNFQGPISGQGGELDWSGMFQPGTQDGYINPMFSTSMGPEQTPAEAENGTTLGRSFPAANNGQHQIAMNGMYLPSTSLGADGSFSPWNLDLSQNDPLQTKVDHLIEFCCPSTSTDPNVVNQLKSLLTADSLKHFIEMFTNFQGHWPFMHMPTFNFLLAYDGLIMALVCVGAVYSNRVLPAQVRDLMQHAKDSIQRTSKVFRAVDADVSLDKPEARASAPMLPSDFEEVQAMILIQIMFMWHGNPTQRAHARSQFFHFPRIARKFGLFKPVKPGEGPTFSRLHQPTLQQQDMNPANWDWLAWVEQEKRSRLMFQLYLSDTACVLYFNSPPHFDPKQIELPLPADDAAWDARSSQECANALGLNGEQAHRINANGSRRVKQPEMHEAFNVLLHPTWDLQPRCTNVHSKFILIHALLVRLWLAQRSLLPGSGMGLADNVGLGSNPHTPTSQNDWLSANGGSRTNSGPGTPADSPSMNPPGQYQITKLLPQALQKWKSFWDQDMALQYPPSVAHPRRFGFCRDGHHFFWLALYFLKYGKPSDVQSPPDSRFMQVMQTLKYVRSWVAQDNVNRGEDIGSVGDIDSSYGIEDLTLDMKMLFKPINEQIDSPIRGVQTIPTPPVSGSIM
ncbi:MAG: hypothetical protein M1834_006706 [Cirrosporium novae-zelandiae]|nr:MAG: hypothetical protein M1834_006706 [Cirrosporium novae-zelandiae]